MTGGYTGKVLRVDLTTGKISSEDTLAKYGDYIGGVGIGYKVLWDEVPAGTKPWDPENRLIFGVGPLSGSGVPCGGRVSVISLWPPSQRDLPGVGHMGGHWGPELKFAGWDSIIIQGKANSPCWISIEDDKVEIRDASQMWGQGIYQTTSLVCQQMGSDAHVAAIGQAGENLVRLSCVINDRSHSAGGVGSVLGSKNLKAIGVKGTGSVNVSADKTSFKNLVYEYLTLMGANNQGVVPKTPQAWAEYYSSGTRWTAQTGAFWGRATPPFDVGICPADDLNKMGLRTHKGIQDHGFDLGIKYTSKIGGCFGCPIRCHVALDNPNMESYGLSRYVQNTCLGISHGTGWYKTGTSGENGLLLKMTGSQLADDYGWWGDYGQMGRDFAYMKAQGLLEQYLSPEGFKAIPWDLYDKSSPDFSKWLYRTMTFKDSEVGVLLADGPEWIEKDHSEMKDAHFNEYSLSSWKWGIAKHHSSESWGQIGALLNLIRNNHAQNHTHINFSSSGLPLALLKEIGAEIFGTPDAIDANNNITPMNEGKAKYAALCMITQDLHDALTLCNWTQPVWVSPRKDRNYRGDTEAEAKFFSAVTGINKSRDELWQDGLRILTLYRALTVRSMNQVDMRTQHDIIPEWAFSYPHDAVPFEPGSNILDKADMETAKDMFYDQLGYDRKTGSPTKATLTKLNMDYVAEELAPKGLVPA